MEEVLSSRTIAPMASEKQIAANRRNAQQSTGPRTPEGKARSAMNALVHGLTARRIVLPTEDPRAFARFVRAMRADLKPTGPVQALLAGRVIEAAWRLRRAGAAEEALVRRALEEYHAGRQNEPRREPTPASLIAGGVWGDPDAMPFLHLDDRAARVQRSLFTALRQLAEQKRLDRQTARLARQASFPPPGGRARLEANGAQAAGYAAMGAGPVGPVNN